MDSQGSNIRHISGSENKIPQKEETLVELGSRFITTLLDTIKRVEGSPDLHEDIDDAFIEKIKRYVREWDQVDFNDLTDAVARSTELEGEVDDLRSDIDVLKDLENEEFEDLKSEVGVNTQSIEDFGEEIRGLDRRLAKMEKLYNAVKLAVSNDGE